MMSVAAKRITEATPDVAGNVVPFTRPPSGAREARELGLEDAVLLERCAAGDAGAFRSLMARHLAGVVGPPAGLPPAIRKPKTSPKRRSSSCGVARMAWSSRQAA